MFKFKDKNKLETNFLLPSQESIKGIIGAEEKEAHDKQIIIISVYEGENFIGDFESVLPVSYQQTDLTNFTYYLSKKEE